MYKKILLSLAIFSILALNAKHPKSKKLEVGDHAPDFQLKDENNKLRSLSEFKGKNIILTFYPGASFPHCTSEACSFKSVKDQFAEKNAVILGVSYDSPEKNNKFKKSNDLPHILLTDSNKKVAKLYNAYAWYSHFWPLRITYVIDTNGVIRHIDKNVKSVSHAMDLLETNKI